MSSSKFPIILILSTYFFSDIVRAQDGDTQDDNKSSALNIESETALYSADINLKKNATDDEKRNDKKRTALGIGESVTVTLTGKASMMEPTDEIQWVIEEGENLLDPLNEEDLKGNIKLLLIVRKDLTKKDLQKKDEQGNEIPVNIRVAVKVKKEGQSPTPIQFNPVLPNKLTAKHIPSGKDLGTPLPFSPFNALLGNWSGASAQLKLSIGPTNVNFSNIRVTEQNDGEYPGVGTEGSLSKTHVADTIWKIDGRHEFHVPDGIGSFKPDKDLNASGIKYPNSYVWKCSFKTSDGTRSHDEQWKPEINEKGKPVYRAFETVEDVEQQFTYSGTKPDRSDMKVTISKFSEPRCTVERMRCQKQIYSEK